MRKFFLSLVAVLPLLGGSIAGRVTNSVTGEPVGGVEVRFLGAHSYVFSTTTDANGNYRLENLQDGEYGGQFSKDGFQDVRALAGPTKVSGDLAARADAQMNPFGALRGRVVDEEGKPAGRVQVEIDARDGQAKTDENGEFQFTGLFPGSYTVVAKPEPVTRVEGGVRLGTVPVYFPSATKAADAVRVRVDWGSDVAGIAIRLKSVPVRRIVGAVLGPDGKPAAKATVKLMGQGSAAGRVLAASVPGGGMLGASIAPGPEREIQRVETREDGSFEFVAVERGDWRLSAVGGDDPDRPWAGVVSAVAGEQGVEGVQIRLSQPFAVPVQFDWGEAMPPKGWDGSVGLIVALNELEDQPNVSVDPATNVGKINGIFPGRYWVMNPVPGRQRYVNAVMLGGVDVLGKDVEFGEGSGPLRVVMRQDTGTLRGTVENGAGATILLFRRDRGGLQQARATQAGAGGAFELDYVPPGEYYVTAVRNEPVLADEFEAAAQKGTGVSVETGSTATVALRMN